MGKNTRLQIQKGGGKGNRNSGTTWTCCPWASGTWTSNLAGNCSLEDVRDLKWKLTIFLFTPLWDRLADLNTVWFDTSDIPAGSSSTQLRNAQAIPVQREFCFSLLLTFNPQAVRSILYSPQAPAVPLIPLPSEDSSLRKHCLCSPLVLPYLRLLSMCG